MVIRKKGGRGSWGAPGGERGFPTAGAILWLKLFQVRTANCAPKADRHPHEIYTKRFGTFFRTRYCATPIERRGAWLCCGACAWLLAF